MSKWFVWAPIVIASTSLLWENFQSGPLDLNDFWTAGLLVLAFAHTPAMLLPRLNWLFSVLTVAFFYYWQQLFYAFVPLSVILAKWDVPEPVAIAASFAAVYVDVWFGYVALVVLALMFHLHLFQAIEFAEERMPSFTMWYKDFTGEYKNVGPAFQKVADQVKAFSAVKNMAGTRAFMSKTRPHPPYVYSVVLSCC
jgi:hypothetical protein